jgi:hypothetical protein
MMHSKFTFASPEYFFLNDNMFTDTKRELNHSLDFWVLQLELER